MPILQSGAIIYLEGTLEETEVDMVDQLVIVETVSGRMEAEFLRSFLNANGVHCEISQEAIGWIHGLGVGPLACVEILVPSQQAKRAREALKEFHKKKKARPIT